MKSIVFNLLFMMLITSYSIQAQKNNFYSKNFETNEQTTLTINLDDSHLILQPSTDGKVHVDYSFEFDGYSKKEIKEELTTIKADAVQFKNKITVTANKIRKEYKHYTYDGTGAMFIEGGLSGLFGADEDKKGAVIRKSKDSIIEELRFEKFKSLKFIGDKFKVKEADGTIRNLRDRGSLKIMRGKFIIKLPPYVKLTVKGKQSDLLIKGDVVNELNFDLELGSLKAQKILNDRNKIKVEFTSVKVEQIIGGDYIFNNVDGLIASIADITINSEFSEIELGEINSGVKITDFNSEYYFYNFSSNFKQFNLNSEYSKIHFFEPKADHSFKVFGNNTINYLGDIKVEMQPTQKDEKFNMMERKAKGKGVFSGHINFDIIHGIIYSYTDD